MKKQLLGTTTLVAAGLLFVGGPAQEAFAAEPVVVGFGGNYTAVAQFIDQGDTGGGLRSHDIVDTGEIQFSGSTDLDNGINVGVRIEYEAFNQGDGKTIVDNHYISFSGGFGILRLGSDNNAASQMHYQAPVGAWEFGVSTESHAVLSGSNGMTTNAVSSFLGVYSGTGGSGQKVVYFTPRINGVQLGLSYQPDDSVSEGPQPSGTSDNESGELDNIWAVALNYQGAFDEASISASANYVHGDEESEAAGGEDKDTYAVGLTIGWDAFAVGGSYRHSDNGVAVNGDTDSVEVGFTHTTGDLTWGFNYGYGEAETGVGTDDDLEVFGVSATYGLGPGIAFIAGVKYYDYDTETVGGSAPSGATGGFGVSTYF